jgi:hypothetical protein
MIHRGIPLGGPTVYTQVELDFVADRLPPKSPFLACEVAILGDFEFTAQVFLPQNWEPGGGSSGVGLDSITCVYTVALADSIRCKLFGLAVAIAKPSNPIVALTKSRNTKRAVSGSPFKVHNL